MAILLQEVQGQRHRQYYFPSMSGVAYSTSPFVWNPRLRREEGFMRLVLGLGTRAVERIGNDYPRMVNLSHPQLRPEATREAIKYYSQHSVDLLDLEKNELVTLPADAVLGSDFPALRMVASLDDGESIHPPLTIGLDTDPKKLVLTFDGLLRRSRFVPLLKTILANLAEQYRLPVDVEFTVSLDSGASAEPELTFHLLQCRPQNTWSSDGRPLQPVPTEVPEADKLFVCTRMVPEGQVSQVEYLVYVDPELYHHLESPHAFTEVARWIGQLNKVLEKHIFILLGPGRWGSSDTMQGVPVTYADIFNARALVELSSKKGGYSSEPSYGTHFFQDLVETKIYPLAISQEEPGDSLNLEFIGQAADQMPKFFPEQTPASRCIKLIHIPTERPGSHLEIVMDGKQALGYLLRPASA